MLSGTAVEIERALEACARRKIQSKKIAVAAAFHSPLVSHAREPFLAAVAWGLRDLMVERNALAVTVALWCLPVFGFYFTGATTPRYFLLTIVPLTSSSLPSLQH